MNTKENDWNSTQTHFRFKRHENFVSDIRLPSCALVQNYAYEMRCHYVTGNPFCSDEDNIVDYVHFLYCTLEPLNKWEEILSILTLVMISGYLFALLSTVNDKFFCPPLKVISDAMNLSENVAGVTILAFGNSASDILVSYANISSDSLNVYSDSIGGAIFLCSFVAGIIIVIKPFHVQSSLFLRDVSFLALEMMYVDYAIKSGRVVTVTESIVIMCIYVVYIFVILSDQCILMRTGGKNAESMKKSQTLNQKTEISGPMFSKKLINQFVKSITPIDSEEWADSGYFFKTLIVTKIPVTFLLQLLLPIVDEEEENNGWSKLLNSIQIIILPLAFLGSGNNMVDVFFTELPITVVILLITVPISIVVFCTSNADFAPSYHIIFAFLTVSGSIYVLWIFATEIVNILEVLGIATERSRSFLGCTLLAWGNSIGDVIADISFAKQGYQDMGFSACFGATFFTIAVGMGMIFLHKSLNNENRAFFAAQGSMGENCSIFLMISLCGLAFAMSMTNFYARRSIGFYMIFLYGLFFLYTILGEFEIIHTFGSDHREDRSVDAV